MPARFSVDPRLRVLYLLAVSIGIFFVHSLVLVACLTVLQAAAWLALGLGRKQLVRQAVKFASFAALLIVSYALGGFGAGQPTWQVAGPIWISVESTIVGCIMALRIFCIILASQVARAGDPRAIAVGIERLSAPKIVSVCIDTVLTLLAEGGGGMGRGMGRGGGGGGGGGGMGGGGGRGAPAPAEGFWASVKRLGRGDVGPIANRIEAQIARADHHLETTDGAAGADAAVIAGITLSMLGIRAVKILPSIPFAPGHKLVILTPFYIIASLKTHSRFGSTLTGLTMGVASFLMGDGRFGVFEIAKHVTPGVVCDVCVPLMMRTGRAGPLAWSLLGGLIGAARFTTILAMVFVAAAPGVAYAVLFPGFAVHTFFGLASGWVTYQLVRAMGGAHRVSERVRREVHAQ